MGGEPGCQQPAALRFCCVCISKPSARLAFVMLRSRDSCRMTGVVQETRFFARLASDSTFLPFTEPVGATILSLFKSQLKDRAQGVTTSGAVW